MTRIARQRRAWLSMRWLLAAALLARALIPDGFMPGAGQWVELCTAHGTVMVQLEADWDLPVDTDQDHADPAPQQCPWSAYFCALQAVNFWPDAIIPLPSSTLPIIGRTSNHQRLAVALPPLRGPPSHLV